MPYDGAGLPQDSHYEGKSIRLPDTSYADLAQKPAYYLRQRESGNPGKCPTEGITPQEIHDTRRAYYANQTLIDEKIGLILDRLCQSGQYDRTLILYTSDHGDYMGDFGLMGKGQYLSEVLMRVPFFLKPPRSAAVTTPRHVHDFISLVDIAPTLLEAAGIAPPSDCNGRTLAPFWQPSHTAHADPAWASYRETCYLEAQGVRGLRWQNWKLITYQNRPYGELYDLAADPHEIRNLWDASDHLSTKVILLQKLTDALLALEPTIRIPWNHGAPSV
jgi:uncharacterized sulfatase